jgi:Rho-binding antiterminator
MPESDAYTPIPCILHERLEFAVLRRLHLHMRWSDDMGTHTDQVRPLDVTTRAGAEWLTLRRSDGAVVEVRLDRIEAIAEMPGG